MDRERGDAVGGESLPERRQLERWTWASAPRGGIVAEDLERGRADLGRPVGGLDHAVPQRQMGSQPPSVRKHRTKGSGAGRPERQVRRRRGVDCAARMDARPARASAPSWTQHACGSSGRLAAGPPTPRPSPATEAPSPSVRKQLEVLVHAGLVEPRADRPGTFGVRMDRIGQLGRPWPRWSARRRGSRAFRGAPGRTMANPSRTRWRASALRRRRRGRCARSSSTGAWPPSRRSPRSAGSCSGSCSSGCSRRTARTPRRRSTPRLALFHPDVAALRRYLYDERYVDRDAGLYRRREPRPELPARNRGWAGCAAGLTARQPAFDD